VRLILSRKGLDSSFGNTASPIFPNGELVSIPIPDERSPIRYEDISWKGNSLGHVIEELTRGRISKKHGAHLDPDLKAESLATRVPGWKGIFGQVASAQGHLSRFVEQGDLFLFFGWFRHVAVGPSGGYISPRNTLDLHVLFGWLQIEQILAIRPDVEIPEWAAYHPHCARGFSSQSNTLYVAGRDLVLGGRTYTDQGFGTFSRFEQKYCLTCPNQSKRSIWKLPRWFYPFTESRTPLTYHGDTERWQLLEDSVLLRTAGRGQEFIIDCAEYPEAVSWARNIIVS
jgi:hypothetical protein